MFDFDDLGGVSDKGSLLRTAMLDGARFGYHIGNHTGGTREQGMHVISRKRLLDFSADYPDAREQLLAWDKVVAHKRYMNTAEVKADFPSVDFIGQGKAVFDICRNKYRLVVEMKLRGRGLALIRHVVTHAEYDRLIAQKRL